MSKPSNKYIKISIRLIPLITAIVKLFSDNKQKEDDKGKVKHD